MTCMPIKHLKQFLLIIAGTLLVSILESSSAFAQDEELPMNLIKGKETPESNDTDSGSVASFFSSLSENRRNPVGISFAANQLYATNATQNETGSHPANISIVKSRIFTNAGGRQSRLHFDFTGGYRYYRDYQASNSADMSGSISYTYEANRRLSIRISDLVSSQSDDYALGSDFISTPRSETPAISYTLLQKNHRVTLNNVEGQLSLKLSRNNSLAIYSTYQIYRADDADLINSASDIIRAGINYDHKITRWVSFSSNWSTYLNNVDSKYRNAKVYRIEVGGLNFNLSRCWNLNISGGADILDTVGRKNRMDGNAHASLSHNSRTNTISMAYHRGFFSANGLAQVVQSDIFTAGLAQRLTRWIHFQISGSYFLSRDPVQIASNGSLGITAGVKAKSYNVISSLEFSVLRNFVAALNVGYQNQNNLLHQVAGTMNVDRFLASFGLQYFLPSLNR